MRFPACLAIAVGALLLAASCAVAPKTGPGPGAVSGAAPSAGRPCPAGTISLVNRGLGAVHSIEASLNMGISVEDPAFATRVQAGLVADDDSNFRLRAYLGPVCVLDAAVAQDSVWAYLAGDAAMFVGTVEEAVRSTPDSDMAYVLAAVSLREVLFPSPFIPDSCSTFKLDGNTCQIEERVTGRIPGRPREIYPRADGGPIPAHLRLQPEVRERAGTVETRKGRLKELHLLSGGSAGWGAGRAGGGAGEGGGAGVGGSAGEGVTAYEVSAAYSDYRKTGKGVFPHRIAVEFPGLGVSLNLSFDRVEVNPSIPAETFRVSVPDGVNILTFKRLRD